MRDWIRFHLPGWVIIRITGQNPTALLNLALARGIDLYDGEFLEDGTIQARVYFRYLGVLRHLARRSGNTFRIQSRFGVLFFGRYLKKRKMLPLGLVCFVVSLYFFTGFAFFVQVESDLPLRYITETAIKEAAAAQGIEKGVPLAKLDFRTAEKKMLLQLPELAWVGIEHHGILVDIHVVERIVAEPAGDQATLLIASAKPGIIRDVLVKQGIPLVQKGQTVAAGEPLVAPQNGMAKAIVNASVWYEAEAVCYDTETVREAVGPLAQSFWLQGSTGDILLYGKVPKDNWDLLYERILGASFWQQQTDALHLVLRSYQPQQTKQKQWGEAGAIQEAYSRAVQALTGYKPQKSTMVREDKVVVKEENGCYRVRVVWECLEDICLFSNA